MKWIRSDTSNARSSGGMLQARADCNFIPRLLECVAHLAGPESNDGHGQDKNRLVVFLSVRTIRRSD